MAVSTLNMQILISLYPPANLKVIDLTDEDVEALHAIDKKAHFRACHPSWTGWGSLGFPDCREADN